MTHTETTQAETTPPVPWQFQVPITDHSGLIDALRAAGLPLAHADTESEDESSDNSHLVCVLAIDDTTNEVQAVVATPAGLAFRFEAPGFDVVFWRFAAQYYYMVTGNMADRRRLAEWVEVDATSIKGRAIQRTKGDSLSGKTLDDLLSGLGATLAQPAHYQATLIF